MLLSWTLFAILCLFNFNNHTLDFFFAVVVVFNALILLFEMEKEEKRTNRLLDKLT